MVNVFNVAVSSESGLQCENMKWRHCSYCQALSHSLMSGPQQCLHMHWPQSCRNMGNKRFVTLSLNGDVCTLLVLTTLDESVCRL